jgi:hypothetical protein
LESIVSHPDSYALLELDQQLFCTQSKASVEERMDAVNALVEVFCKEDGPWLVAGVVIADLLAIAWQHLGFKDTFILVSRKQ